MLRDMMEEKGYSVYKLAQESGVPYSTLSDLVAGRTDVSCTNAGILYRLAIALDVSMESLYLDMSGKEKKSMYVYNDGREIVIEYGESRISYLGPKNLIAFKEALSLSAAKVLHVDTWFFDDDDTIYLEEDYIDIMDIMSEYDIDVSSLSFDVIKLGRPGEKVSDGLMDSALLVSDYMAILPSESSTDDENVLVVNVTRPGNRMTLRLKDYAVLTSNMKPAMERRAVDSVKRNIELIGEIMSARRAHA